MIRKLVLSIFLSIVLVGCQEDLTYSFLMQHPNALKKAVADCQEVNNSPEQSKQCEIVMFAAANMMSILNDQQANPEQFGQRVMDAEFACVKAKQELVAAQLALVDLQAKHASSADIKTAQDKVDQAKKTLDTQREQVKDMLAILGINSPE